MKSTTTLFAALLSLSVSSISHANVWVNEIHYDNQGADTGEFFEIAGVAGTDLSNYTIQLYNGHPLSGAVYATIGLSGIIDNESNGFGAVSFSHSGIQNGGPDGIALLGPGNSLIQFLSYEGSFVAVDGGAQGVASTDIGVFEPATTPSGNSLQLIGSGSQYSDFTWASPSFASEGSINASQNFTAAVPEPQTYAMFLAGLGLLGWAKRRQS